jgi:hypothetical protein
VSLFLIKCVFKFILECLTSFSCPSEDGKYLNCLHADKICNRVADCIDKSDELLYCSRKLKLVFWSNFLYLQFLDRKTCKKDEFKCIGVYYGNICLPSKLRCDGERNCPHGDDEHDCEFCQGAARICHANVKEHMKCIGTSDVCDSTPDCADHFDERFFHCNSTETCPGACHLTNSTEIEIENQYNSYLRL